jgi:hypothetical protein
MQETTLALIERTAKAFAADRKAVAQAVTQLNASIEDLKRRALPRLQRLLAAAAQTQAGLRQEIAGAQHLFVSPRTLVLHGIKLGLRKGAGCLEWDDPDRVVRLIERYFAPAQAQRLIRTTRQPNRKAIEDLDAATLKKLGCRLEETGDQVVIQPADTEVDKLVTVLLAGAIGGRDN